MEEVKQGKISESSLQRKLLRLLQHFLKKFSQDYSTCIHSKEYVADTNECISTLQQATKAD
jgi:hypothetical protein